MESKYKYFIEDADTHLWYLNTIHLEPTTHTYGVGWDKPLLKDVDYWTSNPNEALQIFKNKEDAELWLKELLDKKYFWFQNADYSMKNLIVTEHKFPCSCKDGECCSECTNKDDSFRSLLEKHGVLDYDKLLIVKTV